MTDVFLNISYDLNNKKFLQLKDELTIEMKEQFNCEDYDAIVEYILKCVFENKQSKQSIIDNTRDMFQDKTESLFEFLWNCTNKIFPLIKLDKITTINNTNTNSNNDDIVKDLDKGKQLKPLFNSAIEDVIKRKESRSRSAEREREREDKRGDNNNNYQPRGGYNPRGRFISRGYPTYQRGRGRGNSFIDNSNSLNRKGSYTKDKPFSNNSSVEKGIKNDEIKQIDFSNNNNNSNIITTSNKDDNDIKDNIVGTSNVNAIEDQSKANNNNKKKIRCKNWPQCKDTNCEYTHPTETCPYFPTCMYGVKCMYIHPNIPCKFGYYCTRTGCNYSHPTGWNPGMPSYQSQYQKKFYKKPNKNE